MCKPKAMGINMEDKPKPCSPCTQTYALKGFFLYGSHIQIHSGTFCYVRYASPVVMCGY